LVLWIIRVEGSISQKEKERKREREREREKVRVRERERNTSCRRIAFFISGTLPLRCCIVGPKKDDIKKR